MSIEKRILYTDGEVEVMVLTLGKDISCACGCGESADEIFKAIPLHSTNIMTHYKRYMQSQENKQFTQMQNARRSRMLRLDQFNEELYIGGGEMVR